MGEVTFGARMSALGLLAIQNCTQFLLMRASRTSGADYASTVAVLCQEGLKLVASVVLCVVVEGMSLNGVGGALHHDFVRQPLEGLKLAVPSMLYTVQNNLLYVATTHMDAPTAQILYQLKILTTALFSVTMLGRQLNGKQWASLFLLFVGAASVQWSNMQEADTSSDGTGGGDGVAQVGLVDTLLQRSDSIGLLAVVTAVFLSGFNGVYFEKILKKGNTSVWVRNVQLALLGLVFSGGGLLLSETDRAFVEEQGFFGGFSSLVWCVVVLTACGGLLTALVVKYTNNIAKGFATSVSIVMSSILTVLVWTKPLTTPFMMGAFIVITGTLLYASSGGRKTAIPVKAKASPSISSTTP